jgi:rod shape-determining protein MreC
VAVGLVVLALALITVYFRENNSGPLHGVQEAGASVLRPFEVAAERVARPFRDFAGWFGDILDAKDENERLKAQLEQLRQQATQNATAAREAADLRRQLAYVTGAAFPRDFRAVTASVISRAPSQFDQQIGIAAGRAHGIRVNDAVVTSEGLVGLVTKVGRNVAQVTLLTDESVAVTSVDLASGASGIVRRGRAGSDALVLDRVTKDEVVSVGDTLVTAGWSTRTLSSLFPQGIPVGRITSVGQTDIDLYKQIQVQPFVDTGSLTSVSVLVPTKRGARR